MQHDIPFISLLVLVFFLLEGASLVSPLYGSYSHTLVKFWVPFFIITFFSLFCFLWCRWTPIWFNCLHWGKIKINLLHHWTGIISLSLFPRPIIIGVPFYVVKCNGSFIHVVDPKCDLVGSAKSSLRSHFTRVGFSRVNPSLEAMKIALPSMLWMLICLHSSCITSLRTLSTVFPVGLCSFLYTLLISSCYLSISFVIKW